MKSNVITNSKSVYSTVATMVVLVTLIFMSVAFGGSVTDNKLAYTGKLGDRINYRTGELTYSKMDVSLAGKHGLGVTIGHNYSSQMYDLEVIDSAHQHFAYNTVSDNSLYSYMGKGWHIEYPYLYRHDGADYIVYQNGSKERYFSNIDTLTNDSFPFKTNSYALLTGLNTANNSTDTMLLTNGTKWIFGQQFTQDTTNGIKLLTKIVNRFGDSVVVEYHPNSRWIKRVTSPIGLWVNYEYSDGANTFYDLDSIPPPQARLYRLSYQNHNGDTLDTKFFYTTVLGTLNKVVYPSGDSTLYTYSNTVYYNDVEDNYYDFYPWDTLSYNDTTFSFSSVNIRLLSTITDPTGASVEFKYRYVNLPLYNPCGANSQQQYYTDSLWDYHGYIATNKRISDNDTLLIKYEICRQNMREGEFPAPNAVTSKTTVYPLSGGIQEMFFFMELNCLYSYDSTTGFLAHDLTLGGGMYPGQIYQQQSIIGTDTTAMGFDYGKWIDQSLEPIGIYHDTTWKLGVPANGPMVVDKINITVVSQSFKRSTSFGTAWYKPSDTLAFYGQENAWNSTSEKPWISSYNEIDVTANGLTIFGVSGERLSQQVGLYGGYEYSPWDSSSLPSMTTIPDLWNGDSILTDTLSFTKDSVEAWEFIPSLNMALVNKVKHTAQHDSTIVMTWDEFEYDTAGVYQLLTSMTYFDTTYTKIYDTMFTWYKYDSDYSLSRKIQGTRDFQDTVYFEYDSAYNAFLWKTVDSSTGFFTEKKYYPDGKLKKSIDINGQTTEFIYDHLGRDSLVRLPLETEYTTRTLYHNDSNYIESSSKIDAGLFSTARKYSDKYYRTVKSWVKTGSTYDIVDSTIYDNIGNVSKVSRARWNDSTSSPVWSTFGYDEHRRRISTLFVDSLTDSTLSIVNYIDSDTTESINALGFKTRSERLDDGKIAYQILFDTSGNVIDTSTSEFDQFGNLIRTTDFKGLSRQFFYDKFQRRIKIIDPDVGTVRSFYNRIGQIRLVIRNNDSFYTFFKYDPEGRMIEEGSISSSIADTLQLDSVNYPDSGQIVRATYKFDSYTDSASAADTNGGLSFSKGRLTEIVDSSGFTWLYYDARGRIGRKSVYIIGLNDTLKYQYDYYANNSAKSITYPDGDIITYVPDQMGRIIGIEGANIDSTGIIDTGQIIYEPWGAIKQVDYFNGLTNRNSYDQQGRLIKTLNWDSTSFGFYKFFSRGYEYKNGFLTREKDLDTLGLPTSMGALGIVRDYIYDRRGRLDSASMWDANGIAPNRLATYGYDDNNNLDFRRITGVPGLDSLLYGRDSLNNRDISLKFHSDSSAAVDSAYIIVWDSSGRMTLQLASGNSISHRTEYSYDYRGLQTLMVFTDLLVDTVGSLSDPDSVITIYNAAGRKVKQIYIYDYYQISGGMNMSSGSGGGTSFLNPLLTDSSTVNPIDPSGSGTQAASGGGGIGPPGGGGGTGSWVKDTLIRYYDWNGNNILWEHYGDDNTIGNTFTNIYGLGKHLARKNRNIVGADSLVLLVSDYLGNVRSTLRANGEPKDLLIEYYPYGSEYSVNGVGAVPFGFIDKETDMTGNLDFGPRYFSATSAHFMSPDPILSRPSAYSYVEGNPVMFADPSGLLGGPGWLPIYVQQQLDFERSVGRDMAMLQSDAENEAYMMGTLYRSGQSGARGQLKSYNDLVRRAGQGNTEAMKKVAEIEAGLNDDYVNIVLSKVTVSSRVDIIDNRGRIFRGETVNETFITVGRVPSRYAFGTSAPGGVPTVGYPMPQQAGSSVQGSPDGWSQLSDLIGVGAAAVGIGFRAALEEGSKSPLARGVAGLAIPLALEWVGDQLEPGSTRGWVRLASGSFATFGAAVNARNATIFYTVGFGTAHTGIGPVAGGIFGTLFLGGAALGAHHAYIQFGLAQQDFDKYGYGF